jgi:putative nucleotidyltransferase with HDIG domain
MKNVLFVDDDPNVLNGFKRHFSRNEKCWEVFLANGAASAIDILSEHSMDVVISDMHMPEISGLKLLGFVRDNYPATIRVVLSGDQDSDEVMPLVKLAHRYLIKPCSFDYIKKMVEQTFYLKRVVVSEKARIIATSVDSIPSLPSLYRKVVDAVETGESMASIGKIIATDVGMSVNILKLVNSAFFGINRKITTVEDAVALLGANIIRSLILTVHLFKEFKGVSTTKIEKLMNHSLQTGRFAKEIALSLGADKEKSEMAFIAGILHDVGRLLFYASYKNEYNEVIELSSNSDKSIIELELEIIGVGHSELGAYLLGIWGFPDEVVEAVSFHHTPLKAENDDLTIVTAVHVADSLEYELVGSDDESYSIKVSEEYLTKMGKLDELEVWREECRIIKDSVDNI